MDQLPPDTQATPACERVRQELATWLLDRKLTGTEADLHLQIRYLLLEHEEVMMLLRNHDHAKVEAFLNRHP
jgi:hypothetical protein